MVRKGDIIENTVTGETIEFLLPAVETEGTLLQIAVTLKPNGFIAAPHLHLVQEERFTVQAGTTLLKLGSDVKVLSAGEVGVIPKRTPHAWWNSGDGELKALVEFRPALCMEDYLTSLFALAGSGKTDRYGRPSLLQRAASYRKYQYEQYPVRPSIKIQQFLYRSLGWLGYLFRYRPDFPHKRQLFGRGFTSMSSEITLSPVNCSDI
jgi:quercetin dioxygenase-like cupin family protein